MIFDQQFSPDFYFFTDFLSAPEEGSDPKQIKRSPKQMGFILLAAANL